MSALRAGVFVLAVAAAAASVLLVVGSDELARLGAGVAVVATLTMLLLILRHSRRADWAGHAHAGLVRSLRNVPPTVGRSAVLVRSLEARSQSIEKTLARMETVLNDTAGSAGKSAPLIRRIDKRLAGLEDRSLDASAAGATIEPQPKPPVKEVASASGQFTAVTPHTTNFPAKELRAAVVLDDFSLTAWDAEWIQYQIKPKDWRDLLETVSFDLLFVESAWHGNNGAWKWQLVGPNAPSSELVSMVAEFKRRGVPTVFWNKEDPPHFEDFLRTAALFDWVMTSDEQKVPDYIAALGHDNIGVLPFAAQPAIHNPIMRKGQNRDLRVAFGGMYFRHKYPDRRRQMDFLLQGTASLGLDIYSRHDGTNSDYAFPSGLQQYVRGALEYPRMVDAYKRYKVALNVNSVTNSPSMCARRIFEVSGCGGAIVTPPSKALSNYFEADEITVANDEEEAHVVTRALIRSDEHRDRITHRARRRVWAEHTYGHRLDTLAEALGLSMRVPRTSRPSVSVLCSTIRPHLLKDVFRTVGLQTEPRLQLVLNLHGFDIAQDELDRLAVEHGIDSLIVMRNGRDTTLGQSLNQMARVADGKLIAKFDDDDYYAPRYIQDMVDSYLVSGADIVGKAASYIYFASRAQTILTYRGREQRFSEFVRGATLVASRQSIVELEFGRDNRSEDSVLLERATRAGGKIFASDRFNYCVFRSAEGSQHTWQISDAKLFATGELAGFGDFRPLVEV